jgi:hypothetical protein
VLPQGIEVGPASDHIRIDGKGALPLIHFGAIAVDDLGIAVLLMECRARGSSIPYHLQIKCAPSQLRRHVPSGDNWAPPVEPCILVEIQAVAQMHGRLPAERARQRIVPLQQLPDVCLHGEIAELMMRVAEAIGLPDTPLEVRGLLTNHHLTGVLRIGRHVTPGLAVHGVNNLYVLAPTAYPDVDDDANPTLASRVLNAFAGRAIAKALQ